MTAIPSSAIRLSYLWHCNAAHAAFTLSTTHGHPISAKTLRARWDEEAAGHPLLRPLGERPENGFPRTGEVLLALAMTEKEHTAGGVAA